MSAELPEDIYEQVKALCAEGDAWAEQGEFDDAVEEYFSALALLPEPKTRWEASTWVLTAIADAHFNQDDFKGARDHMALAILCPGAVGNAFVHLRLGQCLFELGEKDAAAEELSRAYKAGGSEVFEDDDPRYFAFLMTRMEPPAEGW